MADSRSVKRPIGCDENSGEVDDGGQDAKDETDELKAGNDEPNPKKAREEETNPQNQKSELDLQEERFEEMLEILCRDVHTAQWSPKGVLWVATEDDEPGWAKTKIHKNSDDARSLSWLCSKEGQQFDSDYEERKKAQKSPPR